MVLWLMNVIIGIFLTVYLMASCGTDADAFSFGRAMMQDIMQALPGIDEAMSYSEVMKLVYVCNLLQQISVCETLSASIPNTVNLDKAN